LGNGRFGPNPSREVTGGHGSEFLPFPAAADGRFEPNPGGGEVTGGHGRSWEVTGGYRHGGGKPRNVEERQEKGRRKP